MLDPAEHVLDDPGSGVTRQQITGPLPIQGAIRRPEPVPRPLLGADRLLGPLGGMNFTSTGSYLSEDLGDVARLSAPRLRHPQRHVALQPPSHLTSVRRNLQDGESSKRRIVGLSKSEDVCRPAPRAQPPSHRATMANCRCSVRSSRRSIVMRLARWRWRLMHSG